MNLILDAYEFAEKSHEGQVRKYIEVPHFTHPVAVAKMVSDVGGSDDMIAAALLHDVVEDCDVPIEYIYSRFGKVVGDLVECVTNVTNERDGNRAHRKFLEKMHLSQASPDAMTIKLADIIHNATSIIEFDSDFAKSWVSEKCDLMPHLKKGNEVLWSRAWEILTNFKQNNESELK